MKFRPVGAELFHADGQNRYELEHFAHTSTLSNNRALLKQTVIAGIIKLEAFKST